VTRRLLSALGILALAALTLAGPALAHVQVRPTLVAPGDPVLFEVIVPGERDEPTVEVTLQVPPDVIPFSFEDAPGWERTLNEGSDGSIETITWRGELAPDGFARFSFLASTPEKEGEIVWKALQTYEGGEVVRWIGAADSDNPAAVTKVSNDAPRQNAGGEGGEGADEGAGEPAATPAGGRRRRLRSRGGLRARRGRARRRRQPGRADPLDHRAAARRRGAGGRAARAAASSLSGERPGPSGLGRPCAARYRDAEDTP
jgi:uncharacterized protein YcnI